MGKQNLEDTVLFQLSNENFSSIEATSNNLSSENLAFIFVVPENNEYSPLESINNQKNRNSHVSIFVESYKIRWSVLDFVCYKYLR